MVNTLETTPNFFDVTTDSVGTSEVTFAAAMAAAGATSITSCSVALYLATPPAPESLIAGFVTAAVVAGTSVNVSWTGSVLTKGLRYRLETRALFNTGRAPEFTTTVNCLA